MSAAMTIEPATLATTSSPVHIRPFIVDDYDTMVAIEALLFPDYAHDADEWRRRDETRPDYIRWGRFVAEKDGKIIGHSGFDQNTTMYHPQKFGIGIGVHPDFQGQGVGSALYDVIFDALAPFNPITIRSQAQEGRENGIRFLAQRGFIEEQRDFESRLDVNAFDATPFADAEKRVTDAGIKIKSVAELADDPDRDHKLYEMDWAITLDMPAPDTQTKPAYEHFRTNTLDSPHFVPESWFVALDGDQYVGETQLWKSPGDPDLYTGATGVLREYRRKGIALALKLRAIAYAKSVNCARVKTWNCTTNRPMLSINEALGFQKEPAWIAYANHLGSEAR